EQAVEVLADRGVGRLARFLARLQQLLHLLRLPRLEREREVQRELRREEAQRLLRELRFEQIVGRGIGDLAEPLQRDAPLLQRLRGERGREKRHGLARERSLVRAQRRGSHAAFLVEQGCRQRRLEIRGRELRERRDRRGAQHRRALAVQRQRG